MVACDLCGEKFRNNSELRYHRSSSCYECDLTWECGNEANTHFNQLHIFKCDRCELSFAKEGSLKSHIQVRYCDECDLTSECYCEFINHVEEHYKSNPSFIIGPSKQMRISMKKKLTEHPQMKTK